jgi:hypothetical protein
MYSVGIVPVLVSAPAGRTIALSASAAVRWCWACWRDSRGCCCVCSRRLMPAHAVRGCLPACRWVLRPHTTTMVFCHGCVLRACWAARPASSRGST